MNKVTQALNLLTKGLEIASSAFVNNDSGWQLYEKKMCFEQHMRVLFLDHEPTPSFIDVCYKSAPAHNGRHHKLEHSDSLWTLTLYSTCDSSD